MKNLKKILSILVVAVLAMAMSVQVFANAIPSKPANQFYLDQAGVLSDETKSAIEAKNAEFDGKAYIYVVTVTSTGTIPDKDFANQIYSTWGISTLAQKNGVLLVLSKGDASTSGATYYAIVGGGVSAGFGSTGLPTLLTQYVEPSFSTGDYNGAATNFVNQAATIVSQSLSQTTDPSGQGTVTDDKKESGGFLAGLWAVVKVILIILLIAVILIVAMLIFLNIRANNIRKQRREARANGSRRRERPLPQQSMQEQEDDDRYNDTYDNDGYDDEEDDYDDIKPNFDDGFDDEDYDYEYDSDDDE